MILLSDFLRRKPYALGIFLLAENGKLYTLRIADTIICYYEQIIFFCVVLKATLKNSRDN